MTNAGIGAAGASMGAVGVVMAIEAQNTAKRKSNQGHDQLLLCFKSRIDTVGKAVAKTWDNWAYDDGCILDTSINFNYWWGICTFLIIATIFLFLFAFLYNRYNVNIAWYWLVVILVAVSFGIGKLKTDQNIDYISLSTRNNQTLLLIKKYNSSGDRNLDEDELSRLLHNLKDIT